MQTRGTWNTETTCYLAGFDFYQESGLDALDLFHRHIHWHLTNIVEQNPRHVLDLGLSVSRQGQ